MILELIQFAIGTTFLYMAYRYGYLKGHDEAIRSSRMWADR